MTLDEALVEARRRWGVNGGAVQRTAFRYPGNAGQPGDLAATHLVGRWNYGGIAMRVLGEGDSFDAAFGAATVKELS